MPFISYGKSLTLNNVMFFDRLNELCVNFTDGDRESVMHFLDMYSKSLEALMLDFSIVTRKEKTDISSRITQIHDVFNQHWHFAGTYANSLAGCHYRNFTPDLENLQKETDESIGKWKKHINGERDKWHKDLEISSLQLRIARLCIETLRIMDKKIEEKISPSITILKDTALSSIGHIKDKLVKNIDNIKILIMSEHRSLMKSLRNENFSSREPLMK